MQMLKYQQGSNLSGSALFSGLLEAARGHRALPDLALRHRRAIVRGTQMRFARMLAWITHASSGNPPPSLLFFLGPEPFCSLRLPTSPGAPLAREPAWHQPPQVPTWRRCADPLRGGDPRDGSLNPHREDAQGQQTRRRTSSEIEAPQNILIPPPLITSEPAGQAPPSSVAVFIARLRNNGETQRVEASVCYYIYSCAH